jgi:hypothetical protein
MEPFCILNGVGEYERSADALGGEIGEFAVVPQKQVRSLIAREVRDSDHLTSIIYGNGTTDRSAE